MKNKTIWKLSFFLIVLSFLGFDAVGQTSWTVSNDPAIPAQFDTLQVAIDQASDGDTIYVAGSPTSYGDITIDRRLIIYGSGSVPNLGKNEKPTTVGACTLQADVDDGGASGSYFAGLVFTDDFNNSSAGRMSNLIIERNAFNNVHFDAGVASRWMIRNNVFLLGNSTGGPATSRTWSIKLASQFVVANNVFSTDSDFRFERYLSTVESNDDSNIFLNNLFMVINIQISNTLITDNIFQSCNFSLARNNAVYNSLVLDNGLGLGVLWFDQSNIISNYILTQLPEGIRFVNEDDYLFDYEDDLRLTDVSEGKGAGSDGDDIGLFGGPYPFESYQPSNPIINELIVETPMVPGGGVLRVSLKAASRN